MKHRSLGKMFALFIVTIGIYRLYWFAKTRKELMSLSKVKIPPVWIFIIPLLIFFAIVVFSFVAAFSAGGRVAEMCGPAPSTYSVSYDNCRDTNAGNLDMLSVLVNLSFFLGFVILLPVTFWWLWKYCKAVEDVTNEKLNFGVAMLITLVVPDGIDILILQDTFNKIATHGHRSTSAKVA